jgi:O-methyltransferase
MTTTLAGRPLLGGAEIARAVAMVRPYSMVPDASLVELGWQVAAVLAADVPGHFVECGVWRGGASFLMAALLREAGVRDRTVWLCDSFEGLPPPADIDGPSARRYAEERSSPRYRDNCRAGLDDVRESAGRLGLLSHVEFVKGWFDRTLPGLPARVGDVAILRVDADWYASVRTCLEHLYDAVAEGGLVVFDDYYAFEGCAVAVHQFLAERRLPHRLESVVGDGDAWDGYQAAVFRKSPLTWRLMRRRHQAILDIAAAVPAGASLLVVDEQQLALPGLPFPAHEGLYAGPPADDAAAIEALERARAGGAHFLAVAWPAFWWMEFFAGFARHLRATATCIAGTDRVMVFDLRRAL